MFFGLSIPFIKFFVFIRADNHVALGKLGQQGDFRLLAEGMASIRKSEPQKLAGLHFAFAKWLRKSGSKRKKSPFWVLGDYKLKTINKSG